MSTAWPMVSNNIIDHVRGVQGVPFARDYAGYLDNRSSGARRSRALSTRGGRRRQQLLLGRLFRPCRAR
jgi:succinate dehydrogenase / fumarate reductase flavoprotein subunit